MHQVSCLSCSCNLSLNRNPVILGTRGAQSVSYTRMPSCAPTLSQLQANMAEQRHLSVGIQANKVVDMSAHSSKRIFVVIAVVSPTFITAVCRLDALTCYFWNN